AHLVDVDPLVGKIETDNDIRAAGRRLELVQATKDRRLAGSRWADQGDDLAGLDRQVDALDDLVGSIGLAEARDLDDSAHLFTFLSIVFAIHVRMVITMKYMMPTMISISVVRKLTE